MCGPLLFVPSWLVEDSERLILRIFSKSDIISSSFTYIIIKKYYRSRIVFLLLDDPVLMSS